MAAIRIREGGAIPHKPVAALFDVLGRAEETARLDGRLADLLNHSTYVVEARDGPTIVGAARVLSDRVAVSLLDCVGVHPDYPHHGIGGEPLRRCLARFGHTTIVLLLDDPGAAACYERRGFQATGGALLRPGVPLAGRDAA
jgi:N-acetylglutamate synthase-like GNAT family acetyltransferase